MAIFFEKKSERTTKMKFKIEELIIWNTSLSLCVSLFLFLSRNLSWSFLFSHFFPFKYWIYLSGSMFICSSLQTHKNDPAMATKHKWNTLTVSTVNRQKIRVSIKTSTATTKSNAVCLFPCLWTAFYCCVGLAFPFLCQIEMYAWVVNL